MKNPSASKAVLAFFSLLFISCFSNAQPAGWKYWGTVQLYNPVKELANYQVELSLDTYSMINSGQMRSDGGDIRFTSDSPGNTLLSHWVESGINTSNTIIWIRIPYIPKDDTLTFYMFYGNNLATSISSFSSTFPNALIVNSGTAMYNPAVQPDWLEVKQGAILKIPQDVLMKADVRKALIYGKIDGNGMGKSGGTPDLSGNGSGKGLISADAPPTGGPGGGAYGNRGGHGGGGFVTGKAGDGGSPYGNFDQPDTVYTGSGGGGGAVDTGGNGGGAVWIQANYLLVDSTGSIEVNGNPGMNTFANNSSQRGSAGGSGGGIMLMGDVMHLKGKLLAKGGNGTCVSVDQNQDGGGGSGGRIKLFYNTELRKTDSLIQVTGGITCSGDGGIDSIGPFTLFGSGPEAGLDGTLSVFKSSFGSGTGIDFKPKPPLGLFAIPGGAYSKITLFPNPAKTAFKVDLKEEIIQQVTITDMLGKEAMIIREPLTNEINIASLAEGIYLVKINTKYEFYTSKLLIKH